jgi:hypothetical protein
MMASALASPADWLTACNETGAAPPIQYYGTDSALMAVTDHSSPVAQEPSGFEVAVRARSWDWLLELRRRLKVDIQLVDDRHTPLLPFAAAGPAPSLSGLWEQREPVVVSAVTSALQTRTPQAVAWHGLQIICMALTVERSTSGALVLGRMLPPGQDSEASRAQLELVGSWLSTAVEAHLLSPPALHASGVNRIAPLGKLLATAAESESDRELVRLFGEAVAVWHDIEVSGYIEMSDGNFARDVSLPGARKGDRPATIPAMGLPDSTDLARLPQGHVDRFGLPVNNEAYVCQLRRGNGRAWLLVFTGAIDAYDLQRLVAYVALLDVALAFASAEAAAQMASTLTRRLADVEDAPETRASLALDELRGVLGGSSATLTVESTNGGVVLRASSPVIAGPDTTKTSRLTVVNRSDRHYTTTVSVARAEGVQFTPRDHAAAAAATDVLNAWAASYRASTSRRDRRTGAPAFHEVMERSAREAVERGTPVTAVVLMIRDAVLSPGSTQRWVAGMRGQMRPSDLAGMLAEGEIGLLMHDTTAQHAKNIASRLRAVVDGLPGTEPVLIGVATRVPGLPLADGIVREARTDALSSSRTTTDVNVAIAREVRR